MHVVWKRPDGFYGSYPEDFMVVTITPSINIWLHRQDKNRYPFRISGGWEEDIASCKLNNLVNLLVEEDNSWINYIKNIFNNSLNEDATAFVKELISWIEDLQKVLKGDNWEIEIMYQTLNAVINKLHNLTPMIIKSLENNN